MKRHLQLSTLILFMLSLLGISQVAKAINIGVLIDGPTEQAGWSVEQFKNELLVLVKGEFDIQFPNSKQLDGGWSAKQIRQAFSHLQNDPEVDMVLTLGYVSSAIAALSQSLQKPSFAPFVMDAELLGLPRKNNASGVKNLNYLSGESNFIRDLKSFQSVVEFHHLAVLIDQSIYDALPLLIQRAHEVTKAAGITLEFVLQTTRNEDLAAKLPDTTDAVVVTSLPRLGSNAMNHLVTGLIDKGLPSFSLIGSHLVEQGVLMSEAPASDWQRLARRNALNMHSVIHGESTDRQPVTFKSKRHMTINMATARAIGLSPRFDIMNAAVLLHEEAEPQGRELSLSAAAIEAVNVNLDLHAVALGLKATQNNVNIARAALLPQLAANVRYARLNGDNAMVQSGATAKQSTLASINLSQLIYSDQIRANVDIQHYLQNNRAAMYRQLELDIIQETTLAYLSLLKAQTLVHIRRDELNLTRANLELSQDRQRLGVGNPAEVYRWESELATARQKLLTAQSQRLQSRDAINRLLHRPLKESFIAKPATLDDPSLLISRKELFSYVINDRSFELMGDFLVQEALASSPELAGLEALVSAKNRELTANQRTYWSPTVTLQGEVLHVLNESRQAGLDMQGDNNWMVGINVSLPLFEGGARRSRLASNRLELDQQHNQQLATRQRVEQRVRFNLHQISASYPAIQLSKDAAIAAQKNLDLVSDAYSRGTLSILDLLDAQNAALIAQEAAANAVFDFLTDLMHLHRNLGGFDFFLDEQGLNERLVRLKNYIDGSKNRGK